MRALEVLRSKFRMQFQYFCEHIFRLLAVRCKLDSDLGIDLLRIVDCDFGISGRVDNRTLLF